MRNRTLLMLLTAWLAIVAASCSGAPVQPAPLPTAETQPQPQSEPQGQPQEQPMEKPMEQPQEQAQGSTAQEGRPSQGAAPGQGTGDPLEQGTASAQQWLALVDQGNFAGSWDTAGKLFQTNMQKERWVQTLSSVQQAFGKPVSRTLAGREARTSLEGAPPGEYVLVAFNTDFEKKPGMIETVTLVREPDGQLRVVGYSSNPKQQEGQAQQGEGQQGQGQQGQTPPQEPPASEPAQKPPAR